MNHFNCCSFVIHFQRNNSSSKVPSWGEVGRRIKPNTAPHREMMQKTHVALLCLWFSLILYQRLPHLFSDHTLETEIYYWFSGIWVFLSSSKAENSLTLLPPGGNIFPVISSYLNNSCARNEFSNSQENLRLLSYSLSFPYHHISISYSSVYLPA